ncbi:hypothetical protein ABHN11_24790 [Brevibacillus centrosporus]|uniref:hypothetical protein n=1 Tax=Brevibacillus centrosporus TaxID=54910 RepID=UPI003D1D2A88
MRPSCRFQQLVISLLAPGDPRAVPVYVEGITRREASRAAAEIIPATDGQPVGSERIHNRL